MSDCGCHSEKPATTAEERRTIGIALVLNAAMFLIGGVAGLIAQSSGLLADALDMLADASAYGIALLAIGRTDLFKQRAATLSGVILMVLGLAVTADVVRRWHSGSDPEGWIMVASTSLSLIVNIAVLRMLSRYRKGEVHLRATWIFTRADVVANVGVLVAALLVLAIGSRIPDLFIGLCIGAYVVKEALEILRSTSKPGEAAAA